MTEHRPLTVCLTGHRHIPAEHALLLPSLLEKKMLALIDRGAVEFRAGGAVGFDLLAARTVLLLRNDFDVDVRLVLALPCRNQTERWLGNDGRGLQSLRIYHSVKAQADCTVYLADMYYDGCMKERNRFMVEHASRCIACWNGSARGGTAQTVRIAKEAGMPVYNLYSAAPERKTES
jgi:uncharacterized phage-like protein YoqJ